MFSNMKDKYITRFFLLQSKRHSGEPSSAKHKTNTKYWGQKKLSNKTIKTIKTEITIYPCACRAYEGGNLVAQFGSSKCLVVVAFVGQFDQVGQRRSCNIDFLIAMRPLQFLSISQIGDQYDAFCHEQPAD